MSSLPQSDPFQQLAKARELLGSFHPIELQWKPEILFDRQRWNKVKELKDKADVATPKERPCLLAKRLEFVSRHGHGPRIRKD